MYSGFLTGSDANQDKLLARVGIAGVLTVIVVVLLAVLLQPIISRPGPDRLVVTIDTPSIGVGVETGTPVLLRGIEVGRVTNVEISGDGRPALTLDLERAGVGILHRDFGFDYRPQNYFGISAVNIIDGGASTSQVLASGDRIDRAAGADHTMGMMIELGSDMVDDTMQEPMMDAIRRSLAYTSALEPLMHSGVILATTIERTQRHLPAELLADYNDIAQALPPFTLGVADAAHATYRSDMRAAGDEVMARYATALEAIAEDFFSLVGELLGGNEDNLSSAVEILRETAGVLPATAGGLLTPVTLGELIKRLNGAFGRGPDGDPTLKVKVDFDVLPVVQSSAVTLVARGESGPR